LILQAKKNFSCRVDHVVLTTKNEQHERDLKMKIISYSGNTPHIIPTLVNLEQDAREYIDQLSRAMSVNYIDWDHVDYLKEKLWMTFNKIDLERDGA